MQGVSPRWAELRGRCSRERVLSHLLRLLSRKKSREGAWVGAAGQTGVTGGLWVFRLLLSALTVCQAALGHFFSLLASDL